MRLPCDARPVPPVCSPHPQFIQPLRRSSHLLCCSFHAARCLCLCLCLYLCLSALCSSSAPPPHQESFEFNLPVCHSHLSSPFRGRYQPSFSSTTHYTLHVHPQPSALHTSTLSLLGPSLSHPPALHELLTLRAIFRKWAFNNVDTSRRLALPLPPSHHHPPLPILLDRHFLPSLSR